jgi:hypothetical protein
MKVFNISYNPVTINTQELLAYFNQFPLWIRNWFKPFEGTVIVCSEHQPLELTEFFLKKYPQELFLISEINPLAVNGRMIPFGWNFINHPKTSGSWEQLVASMPKNPPPNPYLSSPSPLAQLAASLYPPKK